MAAVMNAIQRLSGFMRRGKLKLCMSTLRNADVRVKRNEMFETELKRQKGHVTRIEKIKVQLQDPGYGCTLIMNKQISTPFNCAMHINQMLQKRTVLALVNGVPWDMHRPLEDDCTLEFLHFRIEDPDAANKAYWRSCSFLLGMALERAFKDHIYVELHSWPRINIESGSFLYDVDLKMKEWSARQDELVTLSTMIGKIKHNGSKFERLQVDARLAEKMFQDNRYKKSQISEIAKTSEDSSSVTLYRIEDHIDISTGPMISHTDLVGRTSVVSVHPVEMDGCQLLRFQGVSLPQQLRLSSFAYDIIKDRARHLNKQGLAI